MVPCFSDKYPFYLSNYCISDEIVPTWNLIILAILLLATLYQLYHIPAAIRKKKEIRNQNEATPWDKTYCKFTYEIANLGNYMIGYTCINYALKSFKFITPLPY